jgi:hypothetical protein
MRAPSANSATPLSPQPTRVAAAERAEVLRAIFVETAALSTRKAAEVLNARGVATPTGKPWRPMTVARVRARLKAPRKGTSAVRSHRWLRRSDGTIREVGRPRSPSDFRTGSGGLLTSRLRLAYAEVRQCIRGSFSANARRS